MKIQGVDFNSQIFAERGIEYTKKYIQKRKKLFGWHNKSEDEIEILINNIFETCLEESGVSVPEKQIDAVEQKPKASKKQGSKK